MGDSQITLVMLLSREVVEGLIGMLRVRAIQR